MKQKKEEKNSKEFIRFRQTQGFFNTITENIGKYDVIGDIDKDTYVEVNTTQSISEIDFYKCFLYLKSGLAKTAYKNDKVDRSLTAVNIEYMSLIMSKDSDFTMPIKSKNDIQKNLALEIGKTPKSAYSAIHRLRSKGYLVKTEDNLIVPNDELQKLREVTKQHLESLGAFPVSYLLNFIIKEDA
jgi:hypothetical protein